MHREDRGRAVPTGFRYELGHLLSQPSLDGQISGGSREAGEPFLSARGSRIVRTKHLIPAVNDLF